MGCSTKLGLARIEKARKMIRDNFTDTEIAGALKIRKNVISDFRKSEMVENARKIDKNNKKSRKLGRNDTPGKNKENQLRDNDHLQNTGSENGSTGGISGSEKLGEPGITFIGGNMEKSKDGSKEVDETTYYKCYNCGFQQEAPFVKCPKCDKENNFE